MAIAVTDRWGRLRAACSFSAPESGLVGELPLAAGRAAARRRAVPADLNKRTRRAATVRCRYLHPGPYPG
jgi:hypothetical protein